MESLCTSGLRWMGGLMRRLEHSAVRVVRRRTLRTWQYLARACGEVRALSVMSVFGLACIASSGCHDDRISVHQFLAMEQAQPGTQAISASEQAIAASQPAKPVTIPGLEPWATGPYTVGPDDVLAITVVGLEAASLPPAYQTRVSQQGQIRLPSIGAVQVAGLTLDQLEARILEKYAGKIRDAETQITVTAEVKVFGPISVTVFGDLYRANNAQFQEVELRHDRASVLQAIQSAGGFQDFGGRVTLIPARNPAQPVLFDLSSRTDLVRAAKPGTIEQADLLIVDNRPNQAIYVYGLVNIPGPINMPRGATMSVLQTIGAAGGPPLAFEPREATLMRRKPAGEVVRVKLNLDKIKEGKDPDITLAAGDVLVVPHNAATRIEEYINRAFQPRIGVGIDTTYNPWTLYYLRKSAEIGGQNGNYFNSLTNLLQTGAITPLPTAVP